MKNLKIITFTPRFIIKYLLLISLLTGTAFFAGLTTHFVFSFDELKIIYLLLATTAFTNFRNTSLNRIGLRLPLFIFFFSLVAGIQLKQADKPERGATLWARTSEQILTTHKVDSIMKAHGPVYKVESINKSEKTKQAKPRTTSALLSVLFFLGSLGAMFLALVAVFSSPFWFLFFVFIAITFISATIYFLFRLFRKGPLKRRAGQTREERKREWFLYFKLFGLTLLTAVIWFLVANRGIYL